MSITVQWFQSQTIGFYETGYESCFHDITNVSNLGVNTLKNSSTLAVSVPINISIKLDFVSVNGCKRKTYFVDGLRTIHINLQNLVKQFTDNPL